MRHLQLEHHDRDDDREDAVAERFESALAHALADDAVTAFALRAIQVVVGDLDERA